MRFHIPVHSIVDVITNSSTVIYTEATRNAVELSKTLINRVLSVAGSDKTADDLFDISVRVYPDDLHSYIRYNLSDHDAMPDEDTMRKALSLSDYRSRLDAIRAWEKDNQDALNVLFSGKSAGPESGITSTLIVTTKDGVDIEFAKTVLGMFNTTSYYDG